MFWDEEEPKEKNWKIWIKWGGDFIKRIWQIFQNICIGTIDCVVSEVVMEISMSNLLSSIMGAYVQPKNYDLIY